MASEYVYKTVPINLALTVKNHNASKMASFFESFINEHAASGWDFFRIDSLVVAERKGCLNILGSDEQRIQYIATFRKRRSSR